mmetsp:Transcript_11525/g.26372  ORF Transcript_11525/g.26372 Transcript_11525/m.26372 type:complete len:249 (+) Transcript_11525:293-1039(+)
MKFRADDLQLPCDLRPLSRCCVCANLLGKQQLDNLVVLLGFPARDAEVGWLNVDVEHGRVHELGKLDADYDVALVVVVDVKIPLAIVADPRCTIFLDQRPVLVVVLLRSLHGILLPLHRLLLLILPLLLLHLPLVVRQSNLWAEPVKLLPLLVRVDLLIGHLLSIHEIRVSAQLPYSLSCSRYQSCSDLPELLLGLNPLCGRDGMPVKLLQLRKGPNHVQPVGLELCAGVADEEELAEVVVDPQALDG